MRKTYALSKKIKHPKLKALLLRNNINSKGKDNWSLQHLGWLAELVEPASD
jgi:transposase